MRVGDRFGRWTVLDMKGEEAHCLCDCGTKRSVKKYNLKSLSSSSCGCYRKEVGREMALTILSTDEARAAMGKAIKAKWDNGDFDAFREAYSKHCTELAASNCGKPASGRCAKGENNHIAKHWRVRAPSGHILEGISLRNLIRENAHLFSPEDVKFRQNEHGTDLWCRADMGIRALFKSKKPIGSWKGWTRA